MNRYTVENLFSLAITQRTRSTQITMQVLNNQIHTTKVPSVVRNLKKHCPNVLVTQCFNEENLPFIKEVKNTETGHLFEHILLEYLCQLKIAKGHDEAIFEGRTSWNWVRDPRGKFYIRLTCGRKDADILPIAMEKTIALMKIVMQTNHQPIVSRHH